ncbi:MAG TPA: hypothetical protein VK481_05625 [Gemmatimonadaceae bacterium]|nr:hypothetical protein [Gemmatimonadaceae bacterium]
MQTLRVRRISRYRWPLVITAALVTTAAFSLPPMVDIGHPGAIVTAGFRTPLAYDVVAPASDVLDALTLLTPAQCTASFALCAVIALGFWTYRRARSRTGILPHKLLRAALCFGGGTIAVAGTMLVATRPMASIALADRDLIAIDFHSHTEASHDGRSGFDAERNREWHSSAGFNAAYVTDHQTFDGALSAARRNPARSGDGMVLLPGVELRDGDQHPILIGVDPKRMRIISPDWGAAAVEADGGPAPPILLLSLPGNIERIPLDETNGPVHLAGIEAVDGSPRGMAQSAHERDAILSLAGQMHLAVVSASDNHGWGRTAPAWSVMRIPGWRGMTPAELDIAIRRTIIDEGPRAVEVIARRTAPAPSNKLETAAGGVMVAITMMRTMSAPERISWIGWSWGLCFLSLRIARRNAIKQRVRGRKRAERKLRPAIEAAA